MIAPAPARKSPLFWAALFAVAMGAISFAEITDALDGTTAMLLRLMTSAVLVPLLARAALFTARCTGSGSPAIARYNRRFLIATLAYVLGLGVAIWAYDQGISGRAAAAALALLPAVPTLAMIWTIARYLSEEQDEYLRHRTIQTALAGLGCVLALGSFWGFLETFGAVPQVWAWWVVPVWALGMGGSHVWNQFTSDRSPAP